LASALDGGKPFGCQHADDGQYGKTDIGQHHGSSVQISLIGLGLIIQDLKWGRGYLNYNEPDSNARGIEKASFPATMDL
jgi:hypothetical protein